MFPQFLKVKCVNSGIEICLFEQPGITLVEPVA